ncbi:MAG TPA: L,D-transpeptidase [Bdellovibrionales bacterium]|nr:L,D-transpeptidase [Bdellovibrionales bacterium]
MKTKALWLSVVLLFSMGSASISSANNAVENENLPNILDEIDPFDPNIEEQLRQYDIEQEQATGMPSWLPFETGLEPQCYRETCPVWALIDKSQQIMYLYRDGQLVNQWLVSTGKSGSSTPNYDRHPNGRIYDRYTSSKFPGGDYNGLGNMPYAVFISGGIAMHGTPQGNWSKLGTRASHGCIRMHPDNGFIFNRLVRSYGIANVWITVRD